jgi:hypothetical protein
VGTMGEFGQTLGQVFAATGEAAIAWVPDSWIEPIIMIKGLIALASVLLLLWHMTQAWCCVRTFGQKLRYLTLLAYAILVAGASLEQLNEGIVLSYRHLGSVAVTSMLVVAAVVSLRETRDGHNHPIGQRR